MRINVKRFLLLTMFICICCTESAYALDLFGMDLSLSPAPSFWHGEQITVATTVYPVQVGALNLIKTT